MFNLAGAFVYLVTALLACMAACRGTARFHWAAVALAFLALAAWRLGHGEALVQDWARGIAHAHGEYEARRSVQGPIAAAAVLLGGGWLLRLAMAPTTSAPGRSANAAVRWSRVLVLLLLGYSAMRALSYHQVDALIYAGLGPLHVNHVIDIGLTCGVAGWAVRAIRRNDRSAARVA